MRYFWSLTFILLCSFGLQAADFEQWGKALLESPERHFAESYEKNIFLRFRSKFRSAELLRVSGDGQRRVLDLRLASGKQPYSLVMIVNDKNQVRRVYRQIVGLPSSERERQDSALQWLGSLLYRCDAADRQTMEDLLYQEDIQTAYENSRSKADIVGRLLKDFPSTVGYGNISIEERNGVYRIELDLANLELLKVEIPSRLAVLNEVNELRDILLSDLKQALASASDNAGMSRKEFLKSLSARYSGSEIDYGNIFIPYPKASKLPLSKIDYVSVSRSGRDSWTAALSVDDNDVRSTLILNGELPVAVRSDAKRITDDELNVFTKALKLSYDLFFLNSDYQHSYWKRMKGKLRFRNKETVELPVENAAQWQELWSTLTVGRGLYFYPSWIERDGETVVLEGVLYMLKDAKFDLYHLAETRFTFMPLKSQESSTLQVSLYSWLRYSEER